jgi:hypothetical protein
MKIRTATVFFAAVLVAVATTAETRHSSALAGMDAKVRHVESNGMRPHPDPAPTVFTAREVNAYLASGQVRIPRGVQHVQVDGRPGVVTALARVDFDQLTAGQRSSSPLLSLFSGVHNVDVVADATGNHGVAQVHVESVALDGVQIPRLALQYFADHYLKPKYPGVGLDSSFRMPDRIDSAIVGSHELTVVQR